MSDFTRVYNYIKEAGVFYLATTDGDQPKIRPLGACQLDDGKFLFAIGDFKNVTRQVLANPKIEIVALGKNGHWLRMTGTAVYEDDPKYAETALANSPGLRNIYNEETGHKLCFFSLKDATAVDIPMMGDGENLLD
ncbi:MAG: pyridoxamine 5'-phosphate oxidase family protein [Lachnospiraceae bacterium]|nr:pyridoxamine 5'-phosphate oxidase family protein [Lachnospiraceae bacterium]